MNIPLVDLRAQYHPLKAEIMAGFDQALEGMHLFLGENVQAFEQEFAGFCGAKHGIGVSDGTAALHIILRALDIGHGDEVITVANSFVATAEAILLAGARPVFVDIDPATQLMDVGQIKAKITKRTAAILPVHLHGQTADMDPIREIAERKGLKVIEDACQAHGAAYKGRRAGALGDAAAFSFYFSKNLGAYGEAGFVTTDDDEVARRVRMIRDHGSERRYHHDLLGMNARLDELQAVVLRAKLPHLADWEIRRRQHAALYGELLVGLPVRIPEVCPGNEHVYHLYVIRTAHRDEMQKWLKDHGVGTGIHYPVPLHLQGSLRAYGGRPGDLPETERVADEILSLPMYAELTDEAIAYIADCIKDFHAQR